MAGQNVQYGGGHPLKTKRVYYAGTTALKKNQPLTYVEDAKIFLPEDDPNYSSGTHTGDRGLSRGVQVETPATASLKHFAGILADGEEGKSASWVTIIQPQLNDVITVRVEGTTNISVSDGLEIADGNAYLTKDSSEAFGTNLLFRALEGFTTNSEGTILAQRVASNN
jgi:hypothetical protein